MSSISLTVSLVNSTTAKAKNIHNMNPWKNKKFAFPDPLVVQRRIIRGLIIIGVTIPRDMNGTNLIFDLEFCGLLEGSILSSLFFLLIKIVSACWTKNSAIKKTMSESDVSRRKNKTIAVVMFTYTIKKIKFSKTNSFSKWNKKNSFTLNRTNSVISRKIFFIYP